MRRIPGQAARGAARLLHRLAAIALLLVLLVGVGSAALAWRLSQGPLELPWLAQRLQRVANSDISPAHIRIGSAAIAWEGMRAGADSPLDIRLTGVTGTNAAGVRVMDVPMAELSLSLLALLSGEIRPRAIEIDRARLVLTRAADGAVTLDLGTLNDAAGPGSSASGEPAPDEPVPDEPTPFAAMLGELGRPAQTDRADARVSRFSQLRRMRIVGASVTVTDRSLGVTWSAPRGDLDFRRLPGGGAQAAGEIALAVGDQTASLRITATESAGGAETRVGLTLTPVQPAAIARGIPGLAMLSALEAPLGGTAQLLLGPGFGVKHVSVQAAVGAGIARVNGFPVHLAGASLAAEGDDRQATLQKLQLQLIGHEGGPVSTLRASGTAARNDGRLAGSVTLDIDQVDMADLPNLWPPGTGGNSRGWLTENITAGTARRAHVEASLGAPESDPSDVALTAATGSIDADGVTVWWLRPIAPVDRIQGHLRILDPDTLEMTMQSGRQLQDTTRGGMIPTGLVVHAGRMRVSGIMHPHQLGVIEADLGGPLGDVVALLKNPRLKLFEHTKLDLKDPSGTAAAHMTVRLPLENKVSIDDIAIRTAGHITNGHLTGLVAGRDLDQAAIDLDVSNDGLKLSGRGTLVTIPAELAAELDFRSGPSSQVLQRATVEGHATVAQLARAGLDAGRALGGNVGISASYTARRNGRAEIGGNFDLTAADLQASAIDWRKQPGVPASGQVRLQLDHDHLAGIDLIQLDGRDLAVHGSADLSNGGVVLLRLDRIELGRTTASGTVRFPPAAESPRPPIQVNVTGTTLDLSETLTHSAKQPEMDKPSRAAERGPPGPPWSVDSRFATALMARGITVSNLVAHAENDGRVMTRVRVDGRTAPSAPFRLEIQPAPGGRSLAITAADAGGLLRALDLVGTMEGGSLSVNGAFDDSRAERPLSGAADIENFRVRDAPALARLLQAMTLYGMVDVLGGPGLAFTRLIAPFRLSGDTLDVTEARAFSSSLGLTMKGQVDLARDIASLQGTIVPAYFFNSLLGHLPLIGKLFSPERGGGVFAASYAITGPLANPNVSVNPLTALTPGFLRGLFDLR